MIRSGSVVAFASSTSLALLLGCGGQIVSGGDGGGSSSDAATSADAGADVVVTIPPGAGISCGTATCKAGSETCCIEGPGRSCTTGTTGSCSGPVFRLECDDAPDCAGKQCCFANFLQSAIGATMCIDDCMGFGAIQVCKQAADCKNGGPCRAYACAGSFGSGTVTLGLCAATAPNLCK
jgi:hypothetical protein